MQLIYEDRSEMQRSLKKANIREVFIRHRNGQVKVTALIDSRSLAIYEFEGSSGMLADEIANWKNEHFEVIRGEVTLERGSSRASGA